LYYIEKNEIYKDKEIILAMNQQQVWNKMAEPWSKFRKRAPGEVQEFLKNKKGKVLDLGCGSGRNLIANPNIQYYAVDFSEEMLKLAEKETGRLNIKANFFKAGLEKLPFKDDFFDAALFVSTLHCIQGEENRKKALEELFRVLKKRQRSNDKRVGQRK
jgi:ubiquinone/menaquinone biosynthesis C-methylase UbiE